MSYLVKNSNVLILGLITIFFYYIFYPFHWESKQGMLIYLVWVSIVYGIYLFYRYYNLERKSVISVKTVLLFFWIQLLLLCMYFFALSWENAFLWTLLFLKIIFIVFIISALWSIFWAMWKTILQLRFFPQIENPILKNIFAISIGFIVWIYGIFMLWVLHLLSIIPVLILLCIYGMIGYKALWSWLQNVWSIELQEYEHQTSHNSSIWAQLNLSRIIDELHYIIITFLISINFISIYRPFPIGWDDLWVYMNFPKILSSSGELLALWKMYMWEIYTSIWFLFWSQTYAFFLNSFSWIIASLMLVWVIRMIIPKKDYNFDISLFCVVILLMMPMTVFQLAKDMKLDYGLLLMSIASISWVFWVMFWIEKIQNKQKLLWVFFILWIITWAAFAIKVTTLLLLLGIFAVIFYSWANIYGFMSFLFLFLGSFTLLNLWSMMNVVLLWGDNLKVPAIICIIIWGVFGCIWFLKHKNTFSHLVLQIWMLLLWFVLSLLPWWMKHLLEVSKSEQSFSLNSLIFWVSDSFSPAYEDIYTQDELSSMNRNFSAWVSQSGTTDNADFWRYFWYEKGINNYLKLPWNLTFQVNQKGEFTDITYIFFALLPISFIYLPYKRREYVYPVLASYAFLLLYWIPFSPLNWVLTNLFSLISLPFGYIFILLFYVLPFVYFYYTLNKQEKTSQIFLWLYACTSIFVFLWNISAFWVVWYGILMYVLFLLLISVVIWHINTSNNIKLLPIHWIILSILWVYIMQSVIPHWIVNLRSAWYADYKVWAVSEEASLMNFHPDYVEILFHTNISRESRDSFYWEYRNSLLEIVDDIPDSETLISAIQNVSSISSLDKIFNLLIKNTSWEGTSKIEKLQQKMYEEIITPSDERESTSYIFRVGTFLKYYIHESYNRFLEDDLLTSFWSYFYDEDNAVITQRFKKVGIESLIVDLNAATIDQDPEKKLTQRYENILSYFTSDSLELIETDSVCLRIGLTSYKEDWDMEKFMNIAGVNYWPDQWEKKAQCIIEILRYIQDGKISETENTYLLAYDRFIKQNLNQDIWPEESTNYYVNLLAPYIQNGFKALFEIKN